MWAEDPLEQLNVFRQEMLGDLSANTPGVSINSLTQKPELNPLTEIGMGLASYPIVQGLAKMLTKKSLPTALAFALGGGLEGIGRNFLEDNSLKELPGDILEGAGKNILWSLPIPAIKSLYNASRGMGLKESLLNEFNKELRPSIDYLKSAQIFPKKFEEKIGGRSLEDLIVAPVERKAFPEADKQIFFHQAKGKSQFDYEANTMFKKEIEGLSIPEKALFAQIASSPMLKVGEQGLKSLVNVQAEIAKSKGLSLNESQIANVFDVFNKLPEMYQQGLKGFKVLGEELSDKEFFNKVSNFVKTRLPDERGFLKFAETQGLSGVKGKEEVQKKMLEILDNPIVSDDTKKYVKALYNIGDTTVNAVQNSFKNVSIASLKEYVLDPKHGDRLVKAVLTEADNPKQWVKVKDDKIFGAALTGSYVDKNVFQAFKDIVDAPKIGESMFGSWVKDVVQFWKVTRAIARPAALVRNTFGNFFLNDIDPVNPLSPLNVKVYKEALKQIKNPSEEIKQFIRDGALKANTMPTQELDILSNHLNGSKSMMDVVFKTMFKDPLKIEKAKNIFADKSGSLFKYTGIEAQVKAYEWVENYAKIAKFIHNRANGMSYFESMQNAIRATFDYSEVPRAVKFARNTIMPFATFQSKMLTRLPEGILAHPWRVMKYVAIPAAITQASLQNLNLTNAEFEDLKNKMPDYLKNGMFMLMPFRDDKDRLQLFNMSWWLPGLGDMSQLSNTAESPMRIVQNPVFNIASDIRANTKGDLGISIWNKWDNPVVKVGKMLGYISEQLLPTYLPYVGADSRNVWAAVRGEIEAPTLTQAISSGFGLKVNPVDKGLLDIKQQKRLEVLIKDINIERNRELRKSVTDQEKQDINQRYNMILARVREAK